MKKGKVIISITLIMFIILFTAGCGLNGGNAFVSGDDKIKIVTTLFPQYDFIKEIARDKVEVILLLSPGMEAHSYEPTPQDIVNIQKSDIFVYTGEYMEPWAHKIIESTKDDKLVVVDTSNGIELVDGNHEHVEDEHDYEEGEHEDVEHEHEEDEHDHEEEHKHGEKDPHIWVDLVYAQIMVDNIVDGLVEADPSNEDFYKENAKVYKEKLQELHEKFSETFKKTKYNKIMFGGHFTFGYLARRYGLEYVSPYKGFAPDAEPTPKKIAELIENMKQSGIKVIYYEELIDPKVAKIISEQTGAEMMLLHGAHNVTKEEFNSGISYIKIMEDNLEKLKLGLGYNE